ncbi:MAG TPA: AI-2E family transporter [Rheinheimera sp.]|uniref:AI-2E family transporter n=1 Tax=Rheinheimera TaxID=67575 RepID=UPI001E5C10AE|nr:AI-2E family transporter [Rheinheimera aquimaris]MCD1597691.1 AI-2E family transporter [Rheinheimera aquimaris]
MTAYSAQQRRYASTVAMKLMALLALCYTFYFCRGLILPLMIAAFFALFAAPAVRLMGKCYLPKPLAAALIIMVMLALAGAGISLLYEPAAQWLERLPLLGSRLAEQVEDVTASIDVLKDSVAPGKSATESIKSAVSSGIMPLLSVLAQTTAIMLFQLAAVVMFTYFFLVFGDALLRNMVRALPSLHAKKNLLSTFHAVQDDMSHYVLVVSTINVGLGLATALAMFLLDVPDPLLWGTLATLLNFAPYVGPLVLTVLLTGVGYFEYQQTGQILMLPGVFLLLNVIESQLITPLALGRRFNMNPLVLVIWMFIWGWIWGVVGVLIAIPLLVCLKIIALHLPETPSWLVVLDATTTDKTTLPDLRES